MRCIVFPWTRYMVLTHVNVRGAHYVSKIHLMSRTVLYCELSVKTTQRNFVLPGDSTFLIYSSILGLLLLVPNFSEKTMREREK